jgi:hypothetical protein
MEECPISFIILTKENTMTLPCNHKFERNSIMRALEIKRECPLCRRYVKKEIPKSYDDLAERINERVNAKVNAILRRHGIYPDQATIPRNLYERHTYRRAL